ncbi:MAG: hypothetical protein A2W85_08840 [Bacteroidetes bacterium GWF2_41_31]|nr:MAG: hypothetical protein A2W85_08840 [Bacteroidetes bacterium GWF2_41_31]
MYHLRSVINNIFLTLIVLLFDISVSSGQKQLIDSLRVVVDQQQFSEELPDRSVVKAALALSNFYSKVSLDSAKLYARLGNKMSHTINYNVGIAFSLNVIGVSYLSSGYIDSAYPYMDSAIAIFTAINDTTGLVLVQNNIAVAMMRTGDYPEALRLYQENLSLARQRGDFENMLLSYNNMGNAYLDWKKYDEAFRYYQLALAVLDSLGEESRKGSLYNNLGELYIDKGEPEKALDYYNRALVIHQKYQVQRSVMISMMNLGELYLKLNQADSALTFLVDALDICEKIPDNYNVVLLNIRIGQCYVQKKIAVKAHHYLMIGLKRALEENQKNFALEAYRALFDYARLTDDANLLYEYGNQFIALNDSVFSEKNLEAISEMETKFKTAEKEKEIAVLKVEQKNKDLEIQLQRNQKFLIIIIFLVILLIIILFFNRNRLRQIKEKGELEKQKVSIEQRMLRSQMNPHFIFNSLNSINSFIGDNQPADARFYLTKFARLMRMILENSRKTTVSLEEEITSLTLNLELEKLRFGGNFNFKISVEPGLIPEDVYLSPMLIQPFVENAIIHGLVKNEPGGLITLDFKSEFGLLECVITDNGKGRPTTPSGQNTGHINSHISLGTQVTAERLEILRKESGKNAGIEYVDLKDENGLALGTRVLIRIPCEEE